MLMSSGYDRERFTKRLAHLQDCERCERRIVDHSSGELRIIARHRRLTRLAVMGNGSAKFHRGSGESATSFKMAARSSSGRILTVDPGIQSIDELDEGTQYLYRYQVVGGVAADSKIKFSIDFGPDATQRNSNIGESETEYSLQSSDSETNDSMRESDDKFKTRDPSRLQHSRRIRIEDTSLPLMDGPGGLQG